jgi:hypothetical protein
MHAGSNAKGRSGWSRSSAPPGSLAELIGFYVLAGRTSNGQTSKPFAMLPVEISPMRIEAVTQTQDIERSFTRMLSVGAAKP